MGSLPVFLPDKSSPDLILTHPTDSERRRTWSMTHPKWGPALSHDEYLARETYAMTLPLAEDGGLVHWILTDRTREPGQRRVFSSCETLRKGGVWATVRPTILSSSSSSSSSSSAIPETEIEDGKKKGQLEGEEDEEGMVIQEEGVVYGIGSVFTDPAFRGRGYADRMLRELARVLRQGEKKEREKERVLGSILYSDIGKVFYAKRGWRAFASRHVALPVRRRVVVESSNGGGGGDSLMSLILPHGFSNGRISNGGASSFSLPIRALTRDDLASLCSFDEILLRKDLVNRVRALSCLSHTHAHHHPSAGEKKGEEKAKTFFSLLPTHQQILWHLLREEYMTSHIFSGATPPRICGAATQNRGPGQRIWAVWSRSYYAGRDFPEKNTLYVLRIKVEDWTLPRDELIQGLKGVLGVAQQEAGEWWVGEVQIWNLEERIEELLRETGMEYEAVEREEGGIPSLMWYGEEGEDEVEWVANERFGWC